VAPRTGVINLFNIELTMFSKQSNVEV